jgi:hypothetical protein
MNIGRQRCHFLCEDEQENEDVDVTKLQANFTKQIQKIFIVSPSLPAFQVQVLIRTGDSGSNPERAHGERYS